MFITRLIDRLVLYRRRRQTTLELASLSEIQLEDFGLCRRDLRIKRTR
ncbi:DUF1127 domain-containing protein [Mesorhizobium soli]|uniref:YjiS-like domain-containing protein n=1 Tax=Pseudaminobacter soli (ex Li et al. 2025) TaxID=1295366 RepID=A0A2P7S8Z6_9HYPH|nr:hypothetical protein C7I85_18420 [Mesorhizobium soli]